MFKVDEDEVVDSRSTGHLGKSLDQDESYIFRADEKDE